MINAILNGLLNFAIWLVNLMLTPIDMFIERNLPSISSMLDNIGYTFSFISAGIGWVIDSFCIPSYAMTFLVLSFAFRLNLRIGIKALKLALNWWEKIVP